MREERLLTTEELNKLVRLGYMKYSLDGLCAFISNKTKEEIPEAIDRGWFNVRKLKKLKDKKFKYTKDPEEDYRINDFVIVNYKFYCFWKKILNPKDEMNFGKIEL